MGDRYDKGRQALAEIPVPDQWDEIVRRAGESGRIVPLDEPPGRRRGAGPGLTILAVAAVVAAVVAAATLILRREDSDVVTDRPSVTDAPPQPTTTPSTPTTPTPTSAPGVPPPDISEAGNYPVSACSDIRLASSSPPEGLGGTMEPPVADDPRVPDDIRSSVIGSFPGGTTTRVVLVVSGWPHLADSGTYVDGPFPGTRTWLGETDDGWVAHLTAPAAPDVPLTPETSCPTTLVGVGITEDQLRQLLTGLTVVE